MPSWGVRTTNIHVKAFDKEQKEKHDESSKALRGNQVSHETPNGSSTDNMLDRTGNGILT